MNIGIDIDGVLTDIQGFYSRYVPPFLKQKYGRKVTEESINNSSDFSEFSKAEFRAFWQRYLLKYAISEPARKGASELTYKLRKDGHKIFIISKRVFSTKKNLLGFIMRLIVRKWLSRNNILYDELIFCDNDFPDSKRTVCLEKQIDIMIDDESENIRSISKITKVICYSASYNKECTGKNIIRANNFDEIYDTISI